MPVGNLLNKTLTDSQCYNTSQKHESTLLHTYVQGGDMKFLLSRIYFEMKYLRENSTLIPFLGIIPDNKHNYLGFL